MSERLATDFLIPIIQVANSSKVLLSWLWKEAEVVYIMGIIEYHDREFIQREAKNCADDEIWKDQHPIKHMAEEVAIEILDGIFGEPNVAYAPVIN